MKSLLALCALVAISSFAHAGELDQEPVNQGLQTTTVVRIDTRSHAVSILNSDAVVASEDQAKALTTQTFKAVSTDKVRSELDRDTGVSSWYLYCPYYNYNYYYPTYYYYGYSYNPFYSYNYGNYNYYYYGAYRGGGYGGYGHHWRR